MTNLIVQKMAKPSETVLPRFVLTSSAELVKHNNPIKKTTTATKKVCTIIICLFIKLNDVSSSLQLKYFGKMMCIKAKPINNIPIILK